MKSTSRTAKSLERKVFGKSKLQDTVNGKQLFGFLGIEMHYHFVCGEWTRNSSTWSTVPLKEMRLICFLRQFQEKSFITSSIESMLDHCPRAARRSGGWQLQIYTLNPSPFSDCLSIISLTFIIKWELLSQALLQLFTCNWQLVAGCIY